MRKTRTLLTLLLAGTFLVSCHADGSKSRSAVSENVSEENAVATKADLQAEAEPNQTKQIRANGVMPLDKKQFQQKIFDFEKSKTWKYKGERPAVIDLYADWCGPCKRIAPILQELAGEYAGKVDFYKINVDDQAELAALFNVSSIPLVLFIPMKGEVHPLVGAADKATYQQIIREVLLTNESVH